MQRNQFGAECEREKAKRESEKGGERKQRGKKITEIFYFEKLNLNS